MWHKLPIVIDVTQATICDRCDKKLSIVTNVAQITIVTDVSILLKSVIKVPFKYITSVFL